MPDRNDMDPITDSLDHLEMLRARRDVLISRIIETEAQVGHRVGVEYAAGKIDIAEAYDYWVRYRAGAEAGQSKRWGIKGWRPQLIEVHKPNNNGGWMGTIPLTAFEPRPRPGQPVVYFLYDVAGVVAYVGSTHRFASRMSGHIKDCKPVYTWTAYPYTTREDAYIAEDAALREHKPYLNVKAGR